MFSTYSPHILATKKRYDILFHCRRHKSKRGGGGGAYWMGLKSDLEMFHFFRTNTDRCWLWTPPSTEHQALAFLIYEGQPMAVKLLCFSKPQHAEKYHYFLALLPGLQRRKNKKNCSLSLAVMEASSPFCHSSSLVLRALPSQPEICQSFICHSLSGSWSLKHLWLQTEKMHLLTELSCLLYGVRVCASDNAQCAKSNSGWL